METRVIKRAWFSAAGATAILIAGVAQAGLQDRDLNGDSFTDAFYDTDLDITWLRDANVNGSMDWNTALAWADSYSFGGYSDWRLPASDDCEAYYCTGSEMGHLWYLELGNVAGGETKTGDFQNLVTGYYWSSAEYTPFPDRARVFFTFSGGDQGSYPKDNESVAMAVRSGDVFVVPEPNTYALMLTGFAALAAVAWRRTCRAVAGSSR